MACFRRLSDFPDVDQASFAVGPALYYIKNSPLSIESGSSDEVTLSSLKVEAGGKEAIVDLEHGERLGLPGFHRPLRD
jgi:hypothetical protein